MKKPLYLLIFLLLAVPCSARVDKPFLPVSDPTIEENFNNTSWELRKLYNGRASLEVSSIVSSKETTALLDVASLEADGAFISRISTPLIRTASIEAGGGIFSGDTRFAQGIIVVSDQKGILSDTSAGADVKDIALCGGGTLSKDRGAYLVLYGNDHASNPGELVLVAGDTSSSGIIKLQTNATTRLTIAFNGDVYTDAWQSYAATETGWSGTPGIFLTYYVKIGKLCVVSYQIDGTSDSTASSITLPYTASNTTDFYMSMTYADNGTYGPAGTARALKNTATLDFYRSPFPTSWTASGSKIIYGVFVYETT